MFRCLWDFVIISGVFEQYMGILQSYDSLFGKTLFYLFMLLLSPYTISRPYLAWISSLIGKNRSIIDAYKKNARQLLEFCFLCRRDEFTVYGIVLYRYDFPPKYADISDVRFSGIF